MKLYHLSLAILLTCPVLGEDVVSKMVPMTVTTVMITNVIDGNNQKGCRTCEMLRRSPGLTLYHPSHNAEDWVEATEKWVVTNVTRRTTFEFVWQDRPYLHTTETPLWSSTNRWKLKTEWVTDERDPGEIMDHNRWQNLSNMVKQSVMQTNWIIPFTLSTNPGSWVVPSTR